VRASNKGNGRSFGATRIFKILVAAAVSAFLAWQVAKTSAVDASVRQNLPLAFAADADHPRVRFALAMAEFRARNGAVSKQNRANAVSALANAPLSEEPFFLVGVQALADGDTARGERLLREAVRRNPRARTARLILLDRHLRRNDIETAGAEIAVLNRLIPRAGEVLVPELARMVSQPKTGAALVRVLAREPNLQQMVLAQLASTGADPDLILRIAGSNAATAATPAGLPWQRALISKLVEKGDFARAYGLWRSFSKVPGTGDNKGLYDGGFAGLPGAPPFNWQFSSGSAGVAALARPPALEVEYYGREDFELAKQLLVLSPGSYRLRFRAEGAAKGQDGQLSWTIGCAGGGGQLVSVALKDVTASPRVIAANFSVSPACKGQWLRLKGDAGEFGTTQRVLISDMAIEKGSGT
jgi:hypothetical protein